MKNFITKIKENKFILAIVIIAAGWIAGLISPAVMIIALATVGIEALISMIAKKRGIESKFLKFVRNPWVRFLEVTIVAFFFSYVIQAAIQVVAALAYAIVKTISAKRLHRSEQKNGVDA